jgi:hypothetical protein
VSAARSEVWVNIGYRLSAFGFLACDEPRISGNFGFKDQWLALEYIKANISAFGGAVYPSFAIFLHHLSISSNHRKPRRHPSDRSLGRLNILISTGNQNLPARVGAHSVHQLLHFASRLPAGAKAPFRSAVLQSNAIA